MNRILIFRMISSEDQNFIRDYSIPAQLSFLDFHQLIQENLNYDQGQIASFFLCNDAWEKQTEITLFEVMDETHGQILVMEAVELGELLSAPRQKLLYMFDIFSERMFFMEVMEIKEIKEKTAPGVLFEKGDPPPQIILDQPDDFSSSEDFLTKDDPTDEEEGLNTFPEDDE